MSSPRSIPRPRPTKRVAHRAARSPASLALVLLLLSQMHAAAQRREVLDLVGTVHDESGRPLAGAYVIAFEAYLEAELNSRSRIGVPRPHPDREGVVLVTRTGTLCDEDGSFAVKAMSGDQPGATGEWYLEISASGYVPRFAVPVTPGTEEGVAVILQRTGSVAGRILVDANIDAYRITVDIAGSRRLVSFDGTFERDDLPPGVHDVAILLGFDEEPVRSIEGVVVLGGERCVDDRLLPIDLRGVARTLTLDVVDETGHPVHGFYVTPLERADVSPWFSSDSTITIPTSAREVDVAVAGFPTRVARVRGAVGRRRVVLTPPAEIELALAGGLSLPEPPLLLVPYIQRASEEAPLVELTRILDRHATRAGVDALRRASAQVTDLGAYEVGWALLNGPDQPVVSDRLVSPLVTVHVGDSARPPVIPVQIDPEIYREVLGRTRGS